MFSFVICLILTNESQSVRNGGVLCWQEAQSDFKCFYVTQNQLSAISGLRQILYLKHRNLKGDSSVYAYEYMCVIQKVRENIMCIVYIDLNEEAM